MGKTSDLSAEIASRVGPQDRNASPPPYTEQDPRIAGQLLQYEKPSHMNPTTSATSKFPPAMNGYFPWKLTSTFHLGPSAEQKLYAVSTHSNLFNNKPSVILHDGPTDQHPVMATARADKWGRVRPITFSVLSRPGAQHTDALEEQAIPGGSMKHVSPTYTFEVSVGPKGATRERFEWRQSHGNEIKELATGHSYGWKLVRLAGPVTSAGGSRKKRNPGYTSDGREIVALIAHNGSWSTTKHFRFAFMGSGLTGTMGENWEMIVVTSAIQMWLLDEQT